MNLLHHLGKLKTHVNINVTIMIASNLGSFVRQDDVVHCCCRRKAKEFRSRIALAESDGSVPFNEEICFAATFYSSARSKEFDEKIFSIVLVNESLEQTLPVARVDLSTLLRPDEKPEGVVEVQRTFNIDRRRSSFVRVKQAVNLRDESADASSTCANLRVVFRASLSNVLEPHSQRTSPHHLISLSASSVPRLNSSVSDQPLVTSFSSTRKKKSKERRSRLLASHFTEVSGTSEHDRENKECRRASEVVLKNMELANQLSGVEGSLHENVARGRTVSTSFHSIGDVEEQAKDEESAGGSQHSLFESADNLDTLIASFSVVGIQPAPASNSAATAAAASAAASAGTGVIPAL